MSTTCSTKRSKASTNSAIIAPTSIASHCLKIRLNQISASCRYTFSPLPRLAAFSPPKPSRLRRLACCWYHSIKPWSTVFFAKWPSVPRSFMYAFGPILRSSRLIRSCMTGTAKPQDVWTGILLSFAFLARLPALLTFEDLEVEDGSCAVNPVLLHAIQHNIKFGVVPFYDPAFAKPPHDSWTLVK